MYTIDQMNKGILVLFIIMSSVYVVFVGEPL